MFSWFSIFRKGVDPCQRIQPRQEPNQTNQDYEQPTVTAETGATSEDTIDDYYSELDESNCAGYKNQMSN